MRERMPPEDLRQYVNCDVDTGEITWLVSRGKATAGTPVGLKAGHPYRSFVVNGRRYLAPRVVWWFAHGRWPANQIDHVNGDKCDNRICNLRDVDGKTNRQNLRKPQRNNKAGYLGVYRHRSKFAAAITVRRGCTRYLGVFNSAEEAHRAYVTAKRSLHGGGTL